MRVRIIDRTTGALVREHRRQIAGGYNPSFEEHKKTPPQVLTLLAQMKRLGRATGDDQAEEEGGVKAAIVS